MKYVTFTDRMGWVSFILFNEFQVHSNMSEAHLDANPDHRIRSAGFYDVLTQTAYGESESIRDQIAAGRLMGDRRNAHMSRESDSAYILIGDACRAMPEEYVTELVDAYKVHKRSES